MRYILSAFILVLIACNTTSEEPEMLSSPANDRSQAIKATATAFFETYAERTDWQKLLSFYREDMVFEDVALQIRLDSLWQFERFYNWPDTNFRKLSPEQRTLEVEALLVNDSMAIAAGHFNPFYWYGQLVDLQWGMQFQMNLHFDKDLKIKKQVDWIEYDDQVLESVITRYRESGVDEPPAWLDLEK